MLDAAIKAQLQAYFTKLQYPVVIETALDDSESGREMSAMLSDIAGLSDRLSVVACDRTDVRRPSFRITRADRNMNVRFCAVPTGHEFTTFVLALLQAGGHPSKASESTLESIRKLSGRYVFDAYISLSCHNCPDVVQALNLLAIENPNVEVNMIDGAIFREEVERMRVMAVPTVYLNGEHFLSGRHSLDEIVAMLDSGVDEREAEELNTRAPYDVLVIGAGPAGCTAAIYAARKGLRVGIAAERIGGQVHETSSIENFTSILETQGTKLAADFEAHLADYDIDIMSRNSAQSLSKTEEGLWQVTMQNGGALRTKTLVVATGASWRRLNVPGEAEYIGHGVAFCPHCDGPLFKGKPIAVIGGGNSGVEAAIDLAGVASHVTLLQRSGRLAADEVLQKKLMSLPNVTVLYHAKTQRLEGEAGALKRLVYADEQGAEHTLTLDGVFVQIGLTANTGWLKDTELLDRYGEIEVDARCATKLPGVYAAGDCTNGPYKQIVTALGDGAKASLSAFDHLIRSDVA